MMKSSVLYSVSRRRALVFAVCLLYCAVIFFSFPPSAFAAEIVESGTCGEVDEAKGLDGSQVRWTLDSEGKLTITGTGKMADPGPYNTLFQNNPDIRTIVIGNGITTIGGLMFAGCKGLTSVTIPDSIIRIGYQAFWECTGLISVAIPDSVTEIGAGAFNNCTGLTSVTIGNSVTTIGEAAFQDCTGLTSFTLPDSVTTIKYAAFYGCTGLTSVAIPDSVTIISSGVFCDCTGLTSVTVGKSVTTIGNGAFQGCTGLTSLTLPDSVTTIGREAFYGCTGLASITIPDSVTTIESETFDSCTGLNSVKIGDSVTSIGEKAFYGCTKLRSVNTPESLTEIAKSAFEGCTSLSGFFDIYGMDTTIGKNAFNGCDRITLRVDLESAAQEYAEKNRIPYIIREPVIYNGYEVRFTPEMFREPSEKPNNDLAMLAGLLSWEAEDYNYEKQSAYRSLYRLIGIDSEDIQNGSLPDTLRVLDDQKLCHTIAKKQIVLNGKKTNLLFISVRGTESLDEAANDIFTGANKPFMDYTQFKAYDFIYEFEESIWETLVSFCNAHPELKNSPLKILITGHSLGGAAANLIGARFTHFADDGEWWSDLVEKDDIFVYTFGALDSINSDGTVSKGYENIHNITNYWDTFGPTNFRTAAGRSRYGKFGHIDLFKTKKSVFDGGIFVNHIMETYMEALNNNRISYENAYNQKIISWQCPVDVKIYRNGELVGQITDNEVDDSVTTIPISVVNDEKYALIESDGNYTFELTGTDSGTMTYTIADASTGAPDFVFKNVKLEAGKVMRSDFAPDTAAEAVRLLVLDDRGAAIAQIAPDGTETDVPSVPDILAGDVDGNGKVTAGDARKALRISAHLAEPTERELLAADLDSNGKVTAGEARKILRVSARLDTL